MIPKLSIEESAAFVEAARSLAQLKTPFRHQGRTKRGVDCGGLLAYALRSVGRTPVDPVGYPRTPYKDALRATMVANFGPSLDASEASPGDVALLRFKGEPGHVGIVTRHPSGQLALLHAYAPHKRVVEHRMDDTWLNYIVEVYRP